MAPISFTNIVSKVGLKKPMRVIAAATLLGVGAAGVLHSCKKPQEPQVLFYQSLPDSFHSSKEAADYYTNFHNIEYDRMITEECREILGNMQEMIDPSSSSKKNSTM